VFLRTWLFEERLKRKNNARRKLKERHTHLLIGTPASKRASVPAQTVAMEDEPLLSVMVLSRRHTNGNSASLGMMGASARSAKLPCPTSRREAPPVRPVSPTEEGGKK